MSRRVGSWAFAMMGLTAAVALAAGACGNSNGGGEAGATDAAGPGGGATSGGGSSAGGASAGASSTGGGTVSGGATGTGGSDAVLRPAYNTGQGFFVSDGKSLAPAMTSARRPRSSHRRT